MTFFLFSQYMLGGTYFTRGPASVYDGLSATRGFAPSGKTSAQAMSRLASYTRSAVTQMKIITPNWYGTAAGEVATGSTATVTASIEYPAGTFTQLKWSGATSVTIPNGSQATSDYASVTIPANTQFWIREYITCSGGVPCNAFQGQVLALGDALNAGASGIADQTMGGTVTDSGTFMSVSPLAIISPITAPSIGILGDSIACGVDNDHTPNSAGDSGIIAPSIGPSFGYSNMGVNGEAASQFVSTHANRAAVLPYCSHLIVEYGTNDIDTFTNNGTVAQLQTDLTTIYGYAAPGTVIFQTTLLPRVATSDNGASLAGQTIDPSDSKRIAFNTSLRTSTFGPNGGYFDPEPIVGTGTNNSLWKAGAGFPACSNWTQDGVHPTTCSYYTQLQGSGFIDLSRIHR